MTMNTRAQCWTVLAAVLVVIVVISVAGRVEAQSEYDANALRHKVGFWSSKLVAGTEEREIKGDATELFQARSEEAAGYYQSYQSKKDWGNVLSIAGAAALVTGILLADPDDDSKDGLLIGLSVGGLVAIFAGTAQFVGAQDRLNKAIWTYNRTLAAPAP